jgi:hypothetical protein
MGRTLLARRSSDRVRAARQGRRPVPLRRLDAPRPLSPLGRRRHLVAPSPTNRIAHGIKTLWIYRYNSAPTTPEHGEQLALAA